MSGHTKGPWHQDKYGSIRAADGETIAFRGVSTLCAGSDERIAEAEANTALACAAPDLLEALENLIAKAEFFGMGDSCDEYAAAQYAVAKARGDK